MRDATKEETERINERIAHNHKPLTDEQKERQLEYQRVYYKEHREELLEKQRVEYRKTHPMRTREEINKARFINRQQRRVDNAEHQSSL